MTDFILLDSMLLQPARDDSIVVTSLSQTVIAVNKTLMTPGKLTLKLSISLFNDRTIQRTLEESSARTPFTLALADVNTPDNHVYWVPDRLQTVVKIEWHGCHVQRNELSFPKSDDASVTVNFVDMTVYDQKWIFKVRGLTFGVKP